MFNGRDDKVNRTLVFLTLADDSVLTVSDPPAAVQPAGAMR